ncbi:MAG: IS481 family transposase [Ilumatobacter sp.]|nr:IS481 family transposase [Ilumatobacter sp.]MCB0984089.1 IS481 family transposase [Ilumatobacter sp.]
MDVKLAAAIAGAVRSGEVAAFCRDNRISRQTFYKYRRRFKLEGADGLESRSRRPRTTPTAVSAAVEDAIVRARKELDDFGTDNGAWSIRQRLLDEAVIDVPSQATIWRVLKRRGMIVPEPKKRPRGSFRRFVFPRPNDCWQIDATHYPLADGTTVEIINVIDDHSRLCPASRAVDVCTTINAWEAIIEGGARWGLPARILSDNGTQFNQSRRNRQSQFELNARQAGIVSIASTPYHPQTCGKVERFHQTLKTWLDKQSHRPATLAELQTLLDTFQDYYNTQRPHRSLHGHRPAAVWGAQPHAVPADTPITSTLHLRQQLKVNATGNIRVHRHNANWSINVGVDYAGLTLDVIINTIDCIIFRDRELVRSLTINPDTYHQASGRKTGGPKHPRLQDSP